MPSQPTCRAPGRLHALGPGTACRAARGTQDTLTGARAGAGTSGEGRGGWPHRTCGSGTQEGTFGGCIPNASLPRESRAHARHRVPSEAEKQGVPPVPSGGTPTAPVLVITDTRGGGLCGTDAWSMAVKPEMGSPQARQKPRQPGHRLQRGGTVGGPEVEVLSRRHSGHTGFGGQKGLRGQRRQRQIPQRPGPSFIVVGVTVSGMHLNISNHVLRDAREKKQSKVISRVTQDGRLERGSLE